MHQVTNLVHSGSAERLMMGYEFRYDDVRIKGKKGNVALCHESEHLCVLHAPSPCAVSSSCGDARLS